MAVYEKGMQIVTFVCLTFVDIFVVAVAVL